MSPSDRDSGDTTESEETRCMKTILSHYVPNMSFDIETLRDMARNLSKPNTFSEPARPAEVEVAHGQEDFTIRTLPNKTTRMSAAVTQRQFRRRLTLFRRILGRIVVHEFCHKASTAH